MVNSALSWSVCRLARHTRWFGDLRVGLCRRVQATSLGCPRCRDDTRVSSFSPTSFRRADIDDQANVSRQLRHRSQSRRPLNARHPLHMASKELCRCQLCRPPAEERSTIKMLEKMRSVQSSRFWATRTSEIFKRAYVSVANAGTALR